MQTETPALIPLQMQVLVQRMVLFPVCSPPTNARYIGCRGFTRGQLGLQFRCLTLNGVSQLWRKGKPLPFVSNRLNLRRIDRFRRRGIKWRRLRYSFLAFNAPLTKRHTRNPLKQTRASLFSGLNLRFIISNVHDFSRCKWISVIILIRGDFCRRCGNEDTSLGN